MTDLIDALERIYAWLQKNKPEYMYRFQPGLPLDYLQKKLKKFPRYLPQELYTLYQWHNGTNNEDWDCGIFVYHSFLDIDYAMKQAEFGFINHSSQIRNRQREYLPTYVFPFCDFEGEHFVVEGMDYESETAPVYFMDQLGEIHLAFTSLTTMMLTIAECYETGIYEVAEDRYIDIVDYAAFGAVRLAYNPGTVPKIYDEGC
ncbi:MAG TPA: SMI1/KNR4 family protein [Candidatus Obscuribacterales bacterium]